MFGEEKGSAEIGRGNECWPPSTSVTNRSMHRFLRHGSFSQRLLPSTLSKCGYQDDARPTGATSGYQAAHVI